MQFYTGQHQFYCGVDLHARSMYVCVLDNDRTVLVSKNIAAAPEPFLELIAPYRTDLAVAAECMFTWYRVADLCEREGILFVLGHALYMRAKPLDSMHELHRSRMECLTLYEQGPHRC
jgi:hypothetical protein